MEGWEIDKSCSRSAHASASWISTSRAAPWLVESMEASVSSSEEFLRSLLGVQHMQSAWLCACVVLDETTHGDAKNCWDLAYPHSAFPSVNRTVRINVSRGRN